MPDRVLGNTLIACTKGAITAGVLAASTAFAGNHQTSYPLSLRGIWVNDGSEGKTQCLAYKKADKTKDDQISARLVGTVLISNAMMHDYSEYGEGNFYALRKLEKAGRNSWRAGVAIGIDTSPELSQPVDETLMMRLTPNGRLIVTSKPPPLNIKGSWQVSYNLRRCADLPNGMYGGGPE
jgi:hypothetical protein